jgi:predicted outer membrane repeat protein
MAFLKLILSFFKIKGLEKSGKIFILSVFFFFTASAYLQAQTVDVSSYTGLVWAMNNADINNIVITEGFIFPGSVELSRDVNFYNSKNYGLSGTDAQMFIGCDANITFFDSLYFANSQASSGAVFMGSSLNIDFKSGVHFLYNTADDGGALYLSFSTATFSGQTLFSSNTAGQRGGAIYMSSSVLNLDSSAGNILFTGNFALQGNDIYMSGASTININGSYGDVTVNGGISGSGTINKSNNGRFLIEGDGSGFNGIFNQTGGTTVLSTGSFSSRHNISGGIFEITDGAYITSGSNYSITGDGKMNITASNAVTFNGIIIGSDASAQINKYGNGELILAIKNEEYFFSGFKGNFNQYAGKTTLTGYSFRGSHYITDGIFVISNGAFLDYGIPLPIYSDGNYTGNGSKFIISSGAKLKITSDANYEFRGGKVTGSGEIDKAGDGTLTLMGDNRNFNGVFRQTSGITSLVSSGRPNLIGGKNDFYKAYSFNGKHYIDSGIYMAKNGAVLGESSSFIIGENGIFEIANEETDFIINGHVSGIGTVKKSGSGELVLSGNNSVFRGTFTQTSGNVILKSPSFGGRHNISGGVFIFAAGAQITPGAEFNVTGSHASLDIINESVLKFSGQITGDAMINKSGSGAAIFAAGSLGFNGILNINDGGLYIYGSESVVLKGINIMQAGYYSAADERSYGVLKTGSGRIEGKIELEADLNAAIADEITAQTIYGGDGKITIGQDARLDLKLFGTVKSTGTRITLLRAENGITGMFLNSPALGASERTLGGYNYVLQISTNPAGSALDLLWLSGSSFQSSLYGLTHNQNEIAAALDRISAGFAAGVLLSPEMQDLIFTRIAGLQSENAQKEALYELSGSVIANALTLGTMDYAGGEIFEKIREDDKEKSLWIQSGSYGKNYKENENAKKANASGFGLQAGGNITSGDDWLAGAYAGYNALNLKQGYDNADMSETGAGVYAGLFKGAAAYKARIFFGKLSYAIDRDLRKVNLKTGSELDGFNVKIDLQGERRMELDEYDLTLFAAIKSGYASISPASEDGGTPADINISGNGYFRSEISGGLGIGSVKEKFGWQAKVFTEYLAAGEKPVYEGELKDSKEKIEIWGTKESRISLGASLGAQYKIKERITAYANLAGSYGETASGYCFNLGAAYQFGEAGETPKANPAQAKKSYGKKDALAEILLESRADEEWYMTAEDGKVKITREMMPGKLKINKDSKIYLVSYKDRIYAYRLRVPAQNFYDRLIEAGAVLKDVVIKEVAGVEII